MLANYPHLQKAVFAWLQEQFERDVPPLPPGKDLKTIALEEGGMPLDILLMQLESLAEGS